MNMTRLSQRRLSTLLLLVSILILLLAGFLQFHGKQSTGNDLIAMPEAQVGDDLGNVSKVALWFGNHAELEFSKQTDKLEKRDLTCQACCTLYSTSTWYKDAWSIDPALINLNYRLLAGA